MILATCTVCLGQGKPSPTRPSKQGAQPIYSLSAIRKILDADFATDRRLGLKPGTTAIAKDRHLWQLYSYMMPRAYPNDTIDYSAYRAAMAARDQMSKGPLKLHFGKLGARSPGGPPPGHGSRIESLWTDWASLGPNNLQPPYQWGLGTEAISGRVNGVAFDPNHAGTYYLASAGGGVWKTTNSGANWTVLSDNWPSICTACVAVDPANSNNVYVGTGDIVYGTEPFGLMKSTDGGSTWTNIGASFGYNTVYSILVDPENDNIITAATGLPYYGHVYRSTDGGNTWSTVISNSGIYSDLAMSVSHTDGSRWYYACGEFGAGVWRSGDRGATWTQLTTPISNYGSSAGVDVATSPYNPDNVYLLDSADQKVYSSANAGASWTDITGSGIGGWGQDWYDWYIKCAGYNGYDELYVGLLDVWSDFPAGASTWQSRLNTYTGSDNAHTDQHAMAVNPNNLGDLLIGNDGGVYENTYYGIQSSAPWTSLNSTLTITQFYGADFDPSNFDNVTGGSQDNGSETSFVGDTTNTATWYGVTGADGGNARINQYPWYQYTESQGGGVTHTTDYWNSGYTSNITPTYTSGENIPWEAASAEDPGNWNYFYTATNYLYRYDENTSSWSADLGGQDLAGTYGVVDAIAVAPTDSRAIYAGSNDGKLWMSTYYGATGDWYEIDSGLPAGAITSIAVSPNNALDVIVTVGGTGHGHVYRNTNTLFNPTDWVELDGAGGSSPLPDIQINSVAREGFDPDDTLYVGTDVGVFYTTDGGGTWYNLDLFGLPNVQVSGVTAIQGTGGQRGYDELGVTTFGRGIWTAYLYWPATLYSVGLATPGVNAGSSDTGTVTMTGLLGAPYGGATVNLYSSSPAASVPATVLVPWGASSANFNVIGNSVTVATPATITAEYNGIIRTANVTVYPALIKSVTASPATQTGGLNITGKVTFTTTLQAPAVVSLSSTNPAVAVPSTVTVNGGSSYATFTMTTTAVSTLANGYVKATYNGVTVQAKVTVKPVVLSKLTVSPSTITGGNSGTGTATLTAQAGPGPITVTLSSSNVNVATVPSSISIPVGNPSGTFTVTTKTVSSNTSVVITAKAGGVSKTFTVKVNAP